MGKQSRAPFLAQCFKKRSATRFPGASTKKKKCVCVCVGGGSPRTLVVLAALPRHGTPAHHTYCSMPQAQPSAPRLTHERTTLPATCAPTGASRIVSMNVSASSAGRAAASVDPLLSSKTYWFASDQRTFATNEKAHAINLIGVGFESYYHPQSPALFTCAFTSADGKTIVKSEATVAATYEKTSVYYAMQCMTPSNVAQKTAYTVSVTYEDDQGVRSVPFQGKKGNDELLFDMVWKRVRFVGTEVVVDVSGFDPKKSYSCVFTDEANKSTKKTVDGKYVPTSVHFPSIGTVNCGKQQTGFAIKGKESLVAMDVIIKGTTTKATYGGLATTSPIVKLDTCKNGAQDGVETDVDCGGLYCGKCGPQKKCSSDTPLYTQVT